MSIFYFREPSAHEHQWKETHQREIKILNDFFALSGDSTQLSVVTDIGFRKFDTSNTLFSVKNNDHLQLKLSDQEINVAFYNDGRWQLSPAFIVLSQNPELRSQYQAESQKPQTELMSHVGKNCSRFFTVPFRKISSFVVPANRKE